MTGMVEVVAGSAETAQKARSLVELQLEEPVAGKVYRFAPFPCWGCQSTPLDSAVEEAALPWAAEGLPLV